MPFKHVRAQATIPPPAVMPDDSKEADGEPAEGLSPQVAATQAGKKPNALRRFYRHVATQSIRGHTVVQNLLFSILVLGGLALGLIVGGVILLAIALQQKEVTYTYSDVGPLAGLTNDQRNAVLQGDRVGDVRLPLSGPVDIPVTKDLSGPVYVYVKLDDFFQNHRRYVHSVSTKQIHDGHGGGSQCKPQLYLDVPNRFSFPDEGKVLPCGLIAYSTFNDTITDFQFSSADAPNDFAPLPFDNSKLVWSTDRGKLFSSADFTNLNTVPAERGGRSPRGPIDEDEDFMEWMRPYVRPDTRKYRGKINQDLNAGDTVRVTIGHNYNTYVFNAKKSLILTTQSTFGGRNITFGVFWLAGGGTLGAIALTFVLLGRSQLTKRGRQEWLQQRWDSYQ